MTDHDIIDSYNQMKRRATELNAEILSAKASGDKQARFELARELADLQRELCDGKAEFQAAKNRIHTANFLKPKASQDSSEPPSCSLLFTIHHPKKGYRRFATVEESKWETIIMLAEECPEWGVLNCVQVPATEELPEEWFELP